MEELIKRKREEMDGRYEKKKRVLGKVRLLQDCR